MALALLLVSKLPAGLYSGEDIRRAVNAAGLFGKPQVYGALVRTAIKKGYLKPTGQYCRMIAVKSHARKTELYSR